MAERETASIQPERIDLVVYQAQNGDQKAFMELVNRFSGMSYAAAYAILRSKEDAEDAVQEAFVRAYRYLPTLTDPNRFAPWMRAIVRQECCGLIRRWKRKIKMMENIHLASWWTQDFPHQEYPSSKAFQKEIWERSMAVLSQRSREIVLLYYIEGYTCVRIADLLELSEGAVKSHLHKARKKLEVVLSKMKVQFADGLE